MLSFYSKTTFILKVSVLCFIFWMKKLKNLETGQLSETDIHGRFQFVGSIFMVRKLIPMVKFGRRIMIIPWGGNVSEYCSRRLDSIDQSHRNNRNHKFNHLVFCWFCVSQRPFIDRELVHNNICISLRLTSRWRFIVQLLIYVTCQEFRFSNLTVRTS